MKLESVMTRNPKCVRKDDTVLTAVRIMRDLNVGAVPVCEGFERPEDGARVVTRKLEGIITDRDIIIRCIAEGLDPDHVKCQDYMTDDVVTATPDMHADTAAELMARHKIRRLCVVERGGSEIVGIVTLGDLATHNQSDRAAGEALERISSPARPNRQEERTQQHQHQ